MPAPKPIRKKPKESERVQSVPVPAAQLVIVVGVALKALAGEKLTKKQIEECQEAVEAVKKRAEIYSRVYR